MELQERRLDGLNIMVAHGDADHAAVDVFATAMGRFLAEGNLPTILDLADCDLMDSGGLSVLLEVLRRDKAAQSWLGIVGANPALHRLLELVGFVMDPAFRMFDSDQEVGAALEVQAT